jgi:hypothetical protein
MRAVLLLLLIGACWQEEIAAKQTNPQPVVEAPPVAPRRTPPASPYRQVKGSWVGTGYQYDIKSTWPIQMTLFERANIGEPIGILSYPSLNCTAELIREPERGDVLVMREKLTSGQGRCVDNGVIRIPRRPTAGELDWKWDFENGNEGASSTLKRE